MRVRRGASGPRGRWLPQWLPVRHQRMAWSPHRRALVGSSPDSQLRSPTNPRAARMATLMANPVGWGREGVAWSNGT